MEVIIQLADVVFPSNNPSGKKLTENEVRGAFIKADVGTDVYIRKTSNHNSNWYCTEALTLRRTIEGTWDLCYATTPST
jgi:hypothetical protein